MSFVFTWKGDSNTTVTYALVNPKTKRFTSQTAKKTEYRKATHYDNDSYILEKAYYCFEHNLPSYKENAWKKNKKWNSKQNSHYAKLYSSS